MAHFRNESARQMEGEREETLPERIYGTEDVAMSAVRRLRSRPV